MVLKFFEIFSQPSGPFGKTNQLVHQVRFARMSVWVVCVICVGSWSFGVRIALCLSFWIPDFIRMVLKFFEIFYQSSGQIGKPNQPVHWVRFSGTAV